MWSESRRAEGEGQMIEETDKSHVIKEVCKALQHGEQTRAAAIVRTSYPFEPSVSTTRTYTPQQFLRVCLDSGFIDRYCGQRLVFTPVLRILSRLLPSEFPYHPNWKLSACHSAYWHLAPTIDHVIPVARGGKDDETNWVCTSQLWNSRKAHWTLEELGWKLWPAGDWHQWDGLVGWFVAYRDCHQQLFQERYFKAWHRVAVGSLQEAEGRQV